MCFGCPKEPSHWDGSFEYPQHMFWMRNKEISFQYTLLSGCLIWISFNLACAYGEVSNQSAHPHSLVIVVVLTPEESLDPQLHVHIERPLKAQADLSLQWTHTCIICWIPAYIGKDLGDINQLIFILQSKLVCFFHGFSQCKAVINSMFEATWAVWTFWSG